jgi:hypothetical protein
LSAICGRAYIPSHLGEYATYVRVALRTCGVTCRDIEGLEHTVEVSADSLCEAVARGLAALRDTDGAGDMEHGQTTTRVGVKHPEVEHKVRMRDFEVWLESNGQSEDGKTWRFVTF